MKTAAEQVPTYYTPSGIPMPRFKRRWSNLYRLRWKASLIMSKYEGVDIYIRKGRGFKGNVFQYGLFQISISTAHTGMGISGMPVDKAWDYLTGIDIGIDIGRNLK